LNAILFLEQLPTKLTTVVSNMPYVNNDEYKRYLKWRRPRRKLAGINEAIRRKRRHLKRLEKRQFKMIEQFERKIQQRRTQYIKWHHDVATESKTPAVKTLTFRLRYGPCTVPAIILQALGPDNYFAALGKFHETTTEEINMIEHHEVTFRYAIAMLDLAHQDPTFYTKYKAKLDISYKPYMEYYGLGDYASYEDSYHERLRPPTPPRSRGLSPSPPRSPSRSRSRSPQ